MDLSPLVRILADGGFHSGRSLGQQLGVTRTVVGQQIELLRAMGVEVHSVTGKGYRLPTLFDPLSRSAILHMMREQSALWASRFDLKFSTGSTNADAMEMARQGETRYLVLAEHQAAGRGRRGREWVSPLGANIAMSLLWTFELPIAALEGLSLAVATLVVEGLRNAGYKEGIGVKWPNDILLRGAKLAGILIEVGGETAGPAWVVIGIGINVRMPWFCQQQIGQAYTDLASNFELSMDRNRIVASVLGALSTGLPVFAKKGFAAFRDAWNELDVYQGRQVAIVSGSHRSIGLALGVTDSGALILDTAAGRQLIAGGELTPSLRPAEEVACDS
ncbi:MAG: biotin--[acetyl-CoA-carboxylase] ligase [Pseudomonadales bacterium]|nr:biotin--[acetyl-CoA-carboxylase] ligase [Pseudomonadales bacterium]